MHMYIKFSIIIMLLLSSFQLLAVTPLPKGIVPTSIEISTPTSKSGQAYKFFANKKHEALLYIRVEANKSISEGDILAATELYSDTTQKAFSRDDNIPPKGPFPVYSKNNNGFDEALPSSGTALNSADVNPNSIPQLGNTKVAEFFFKASKAVRYSVCARIYYYDTQNKEQSLSTCSDAVDAPVFIVAILAKNYTSASFSTSAKELSYSAAPTTLNNNSVVLNRYEFNSQLSNNGYHIKQLADTTGQDGKVWPGWGNDWVLIAGLGGINDGLVEAKNYYQGSKGVSPGSERWDDTSEFHWPANMTIYKKGENFHTEDPYAFDVGTMHLPGAGSWGKVMSHRFVGIDNYGNPIDVGLNVCAGSSDYAAKCK